MPSPTGQAAAMKLDMPGSLFPGYNEALADSLSAWRAMRQFQVEPFGECERLSYSMTKRKGREDTCLP